MTDNRANKCSVRINSISTAQNMANLKKTQATLK